jgi:hypothetical protein
MMWEFWNASLASHSYVSATLSTHYFKAYSLVLYFWMGSTWSRGDIEVLPWHHIHMCLHALCRQNYCEPCAVPFRAKHSHSKFTVASSWIGSRRGHPGVIVLQFVAMGVWGRYSGEEAIPVICITNNFGFLHRRLKALWTSSVWNFQDIKGTQRSKKNDTNLLYSSFTGAAGHWSSRYIYCGAEINLDGISQQNTCGDGTYDFENFCHDSMDTSHSNLYPRSDVHTQNLRTSPSMVLWSLASRMHSWQSPVLCPPFRCWNGSQLSRIITPVGIPTPVGIEWNNLPGYKIARTSERPIGA